MPGKFDVVVEATGKGGVAIEGLLPLRSDRFLCFLGVYRERKACQDFGKVLTALVLWNCWIFGSVSSDKPHFERDIRDMFEIRRRYVDVLVEMISELPASDFCKAFSLGKNNIKTVVYFK